MLSSDVKIKKEDVCHFLGVPAEGLPKDLELSIDEGISEASALIRPGMVVRVGDLERDSSGISLFGVELKGEAIADFLEGSDEAALMAVTAGMDIERRIRQLEITDMPKALILDACASAAAEQIADIASDELEKSLSRRGLCATERFSPGYSDLPLEIQPDVLAALDAGKRIGLTCSESCLLFPRKSITAVVGVRDKPRAPRGPRCEMCLLKEKCKHGLCSFERA